MLSDDLVNKLHAKYPEVAEKIAMIYMINPNHRIDNLFKLIYLDVPLKQNEIDAVSNILFFLTDERTRKLHKTYYAKQLESSLGSEHMFTGGMGEWSTSSCRVEEYSLDEHGVHHYLLRNEFGDYIKYSGSEEIRWSNLDIDDTGLFNYFVFNNVFDENDRPISYVDRISVVRR